MTAVATIDPTTTPKALTQGEKLRAKMEAIVPMLVSITGDTGYANRALQLLVLAANGNPEIYECTQASIAASILKAGQWGLDIGETVHIVPFNVKVSKRGEPDKWEKRAQAIPDYRGLMQLAKDGGGVREFKFPRVVREGDTFDVVYGLNENLTHTPAPQAQRGRITGAYVIAVLPFGVMTFAYLPIEDIEAIRAKSKSWGPKFHPECPEWYAIKTVLRHFCSKLPKKGKKLAAALAYDDTEDMPDGEMSELTVIASTKPKAIASPTNGEYGNDATHVDMPDPDTALRNAQRGASQPDPYQSDAAA